MSLLEQITQRTANLYSLPEVALEVLELTNQPRVDLQALKDCIERDPALASKLLKVVNSSVFGLARKVIDLNQALSLLGVKPLKMLVLGFSLPKDLTNDIETWLLSRYWRHTLIKAVACRELAERYWHVEGDEAFIAGLLQDIGELVLLQQLGEPYQRFLRDAYDSTRSLPELETAALGFDHATVTARLLDRWGLPVFLVKAVSVPLETRRIAALPAADRALPELLHVGELIAQLLTRRSEGKLQELLDVARAYRSLDYAALHGLIQNLEDKVAALGEVLNLYHPDGAPFSEIMASAHLRLAQVAEEATCEMTGGVLLETCELAAELKSAVESRPLISSPSHAPATPAATVDRSSWRRPNSSPSRGTAVASAPPQLLAATRWQTNIATAIEHARERRECVSLLLVQIDKFQDVFFTLGQEWALRLTKLLESAVHALAAEDGEAVLAGEARFAAWWIGADRQQTVDRGRQLVRALHDWIASHDEIASQKLGISVGVATLPLPTRNFPAGNLSSAAERCLSAAQASGGNCVKSIEV